MVRLFEKQANGLLLEVSPEEADARRAGRRCSRTWLECDILFSVAEEAARDAEEAAFRAAAEISRGALEEEAKAIGRVREQALKKLEKLGLSAEDIKAIMGS